ncbi:hypothetical protein [uncultured Thiothrix sp.]|uniref:hypothetical protein n=1 Tax=uncultured Thiothrix sp. TaxID=223185 RepID=UPI0026290F7F|nr:hypothetical protein [uncultured Thiothrix sp.]
MKAQLSLAAVIMTGLLASGCSQMSAQQVVEPPPAPTPDKVVLDCSKCAPAPVVTPRPVVKPRPIVRPRPQPRPPVVVHPRPQPQPRPPVVVVPPVKVPPVKAKGNYRGKIQIDQGVMKQYQQ